MITITGLSEAQERRIRLADNRIALLAGWDPDLVRSELDFVERSGLEAKRDFTSPIRQVIVARYVFLAHMIASIVFDWNIVGETTRGQSFMRSRRRTASSAAARTDIDASSSTTGSTQVRQRARSAFCILSGLTALYRTRESVAERL
ncbi:hypothetical protein [Sphingobium subterraneum]|uniref:Uncharacterized protein n=1 Tax=Sphingobium subterraneum TaxID=627688 RepID=A0A841J627_9SPHN|nr:hypothetical protein [Sphingobium subterraneum]MBB6123978.1 hypothetical protein [Sphingobium subterraneum]